MVSAEPEPFVNVQPIPHKPGRYLLTDGTVVTYPRPKTPKGVKT
jgi:hypothetical protein